MKSLKIILLIIMAVIGFVNTGVADNTAAVLLNVSYDPTRELYAEYDKAFTKHWKKETGQDLSIQVSNGGSGKQARAVIDGLEADVATLALSNDIDVISEKSGLLPQNWQSRLPYNSSPYTSTIVFVVRKGNPKNIKDWDDLAMPGVAVITPNPKTGGAPRWAFLAAWGYALDKYGSEDKARELVTKLYKNVAVLDSGARGSTTTFAERGIGDVLVTWENEAYLTLNQFGKDQYRIVDPSISILAEPSVAWVDKNNQKHGTEKVSQAYLKWLYSREGQEIVARHYYRPRDKAVLAEYKKQFPRIKLFTINKVFGGWKKAQSAYFADGAVFDQIYQPK